MRRGGGLERNHDFRTQQGNSAQPSCGQDLPSGAPPISSLENRALRIVNPFVYKRAFLQEIRCVDSQTVRPRGGWDPIGTWAGVRFVWMGVQCERFAAPIERSFGEQARVVRVVHRWRRGSAVGARPTRSTGWWSIFSFNDVISDLRRLHSNVPLSGSRLLSDCSCQSLTARCPNLGRFSFGMFRFGRWGCSRCRYSSLNQYIRCHVLLLSRSRVLSFTRPWKVSSASSGVACMCPGLI